MKLTGKILFTSIFLVICAICASSAFAASAVKDLRITDPGPQALEAGKTATFNVSFAGSGVERIAVQPSGAGLSAKVINASWKPYPNTCSATVSITAANNFQGGKVAFLLLNNGRNIKSQEIHIAAFVAPDTSSTTSLPNLTVRVAQSANAINLYNEALSNPALTSEQKSPFQTCLSQLTAYNKQAKNSSIGLSSDPGPLPACGTAILTGKIESGGTTTNTPIQLTSVSVDKNTGGSGDLFTFRATTNIAAANVVVEPYVANNSKHKMNSSDGKNWILNIKGSSLGSGSIPINIQATGKTGGFSRKGLNVTVNGGEITAPVSTIDGADCAINIAKGYLNTTKDSGYCLIFVSTTTYNRCGISICPGECRTAKQLASSRTLQNAGHPEISPPRGALVFWNFVGTNGQGKKENLGHVGISLGDGTFISALSTVKISKLNGYDNKNYLGWCYPSSKNK